MKYTYNNQQYIASNLMHFLFSHLVDHPKREYNTIGYSSIKNLTADLDIDPNDEKTCARVLAALEHLAFGSFELDKNRRGNMISFSYVLFEENDVHDRLLISLSPNTSEWEYPEDICLNCGRRGPRNL